MKTLILNKNIGEQNKLFTVQSLEEIRIFAKMMFPDGIPAKGQCDSENIEITKQFLKEEFNVIFNACFGDDMFAAEIDIFSTSMGFNVMYLIVPSVEVKETHIINAAFKYFLASKDIVIDKVRIIHLNKNYTFRRNEDSVCLEEIFCFKNITNHVQSLQPILQDYTENQLWGLKSNEKFLPSGTQCSSPEDFNSYNWKEEAKNRFQYLVKRFQRERTAWAPGFFKKFYSNTTNMGINRRPVFKHLVEKKDIVLKKNRIRQMFSQIRYPLHAVSFCLMAYAIPPFACKEKLEIFEPYPISFQTSSANDETHSITNYTFNVNPKLDERELYLDKFLSSTRDNGSILVYSRQVISTLNHLAELFPSYKASIQNRLARMIDVRECLSGFPFYINMDRASVLLSTLQPEEVSSEAEAMIKLLTYLVA